MNFTISSDFTENFTENSMKINLSFSLFIFIFGTIGNILNILILTQRIFRSNPCIFLFLVSSMANLISILFGLIPRILSYYKLDFTATNNIPCKFRAFITFSSRTIAFWLIMLATIDRYLTSSYDIHLRKLSSLKNARKSSMFVVGFSLLCYSQMLFCYQANLTNTPLKCYGKTSFCRLLTDLTYTFLTVSFPMIIMTICGLMTILNIRQRHYCLTARKLPNERQVSQETIVLMQQQRQRWKKLERYLFQMLLLQVVSLILLTVPLATHKLYFTLTFKPNKSTLDYEYDRFFYRFELLLPYLESALPFYIYTLTGGRIFRGALQKLRFSF